MTPTFEEDRKLDEGVIQILHDGSAVLQTQLTISEARLAEMES